MNSESLDFNPPLVSVIIPAYNAERFISKTLQSVSSQTYKNIEVLVVDDGSTDQTAAIVRSFANTDPRIILLQQKNAGVATARNLAIQRSRGDYIAPIDADDIWFPQNLEKQVSCLIKSPENVGVVYTWSVDIDETDSLMGGFYNSTIEGEVLTTLIYKYFPSNACASLIRRACFDKVGGYDSQLKEQNAQGCEDWDLHLRIAQYYEFRVVPEFLIGYRQISSSMSCDCTKMAKSYHLVMNGVQQRHPTLPSFIYDWSCSNFYMYLAYKNFKSNSNQETLIWLQKALMLDLKMTLLRHNFYVLLLQASIRIIIAWIKPSFESQSPLNLAKKVTMNDVFKRTKIHSLLPAQQYEEYRFKHLLKLERQISLPEASLSQVS